jgi:hypothetical protein
MKAMILVTICATTLGAASYAQTDTTRGPKPVTPTQTQPTGLQSPSQTTPTVQPQQQAFPQAQPMQQTQPVQQTQPGTTLQPSPMLNNPSTPNGWTPVNSQNVPDNLRQTLINTPTYNGWETGSIYTNQTNGMYQLRTSDTNNPQTYYFDKDGKVTTAPPHK